MAWPVAWCRCHRPRAPDRACDQSPLADFSPIPGPRHTLTAEATIRNAAAACRSPPSDGKPC